jgi:rubredoxin
MSALHTTCRECGLVFRHDTGVGGIEDSWRGECPRCGIVNDEVTMTRVLHDGDDG